MKGRRGHILPLTAPVVAIIRVELTRQAREARVEGRPVGEHVFSSRFQSKERLARHSLSQALRRLIPMLDATGPDGHIVKRLQADPPEPKTFRATLTTGLAWLGVNREDRRAVLAHVEDNVLGQHYDSYDRLPEKRRALELWANYVDALLRGEKPTGDVVPLRAPS